MKKSFAAPISEYNALLIFRSVEIIIVDNGKTHNPMYLQVSALGELLGMSKKQIEMKVISNIFYNQDSNSFSYKDHQNILNKVLIINEPVIQDNENNAVPEIIRSKIYLYEYNKEL